MRAQMQWILTLTVIGLALAGSLGFIKAAEYYLTQRLQRQIIEDNEVIGSNLLEVLRDDLIVHMPPEEQRAALQQVCDRVSLPNGGFVCAISMDGDVLAMPGMGGAMSVADATIVDPANDLAIAFADLEADQAIGGLFHQGEKTHIISSLPVEDAGFRLHVHQDMHVLEASVAQTLRPLYFLGFGLAALLGIAAFLIANRTVRKYEHRLEHANAELARTNEELSHTLEERQIFYEGFDRATHAMFITEDDGAIRYVNPAFEALYGIDQDKAKGRNPRILNPGREAYRELGYSREAYDALFEGLWRDIMDPAKGSWEGELPNRKNNGDIVWVHLMIHAIRDAAGSITHYIGIPINITEKRERELAIRVECYRALAELAEMRDNETGKHLERVSHFARRLAEELGMPRQFCSDIALFAPLHDIGKVGISDDILLAPRKLSPSEWETMKTHAALGAEILQKRETLEMAADICRGHHERYDGTGYPDALVGAGIPLAARIVALCDVYDALRSARPYKEAWTHEKTVSTIAGDRGTHFDPHVVDAFLRIASEFEAFSDAHADEGPVPPDDKILSYAAYI